MTSEALNPAVTSPRRSSVRPSPAHPDKPTGSPRALTWASDGASDEGFFGPDSISWKVLGAPAVPLMIAQITHILEATHVDFQSVLVDHDPLYPSNAKRQRGWRGDPRKKGGRLTDRFRRTVTGPLPIIFGDRASARRCADRLTAYHRPMRGINGDDEQPYSAVDPETMLFAAVTIAHGALIAYESFAFRGARSPQRLPDEERDRFFTETAELAVLMGVPRDVVPTTADQVDDYYRSLSDKYRSRKGYFRLQLKTAASQFKWTESDTLPTMAADLLLVASSFLAYIAVPAPCRRLHHIPRAADPLLKAVHLLSLPLFSALQLDAVGRPVLERYLGKENAEGIRRSVNATR